MKIKGNLYNELNSHIYNQDNNQTWINPILQKPIFKIYLLCIYIFVAFVLLKDINIHNIEKIQINFYLIYLVLTLIGIILFIANKIKTKIFIKKSEKAEKDLNKINFEYYREILNEFSPGVLAFCYNKNLQYEDIIISTLLSFDNKYIKLDMLNKRIYILPDKDDSNLKEYERYLLKKITDISTNVAFQELKKVIKDTYFKSNFLNLIKRDCKNSSYFQTVYRGNTLLSRTFIISLLIFFVSVYICTNKLYKDIIFVGLTNIIILIVLMFLDRKNAYMMTSKGQEINIKLNGLKKYIVDYSSINDKKIKEIKIWEYYIIYAIILDLKGKLNKEVSDFYKEIS